MAKPRKFSHRLNLRRKPQRTGVIDKPCSSHVPFHRLKCRGQDTFSHDSGSPSRVLSRCKLQIAQRSRRPARLVYGLVITTTVILINSPVDAISTLPRSMDGRIVDPSFAARGRIAVLVSCLRLLSHDYARTNNFVQTRHPLAKPLNTAAKYVTWLKIQGHVLARYKIRVSRADKSLPWEGYSHTFYTNRLNPRKFQWITFYIEISIFLFNLVFIYIYITLRLKSFYHIPWSSEII